MLTNTDRNLINRLANITNVWVARLRSRWYHQTLIGRHVIELPAKHQLDVYRAAHPMYDVHIQHIGFVLANKYQKMWAVDIGANVGDTAAAICSSVAIPTVCIEGDPVYYPLLKKNAKKIGDFVYPINIFVGGRSGVIAAQRIIRAAGTAHLAQCTDEVDVKCSVEMKPLSEILMPFAQHCFKFLKVDTDGHDFEILVNAIDWLHTHRPVILFECDTSFRPDGAIEARRTFESLKALGYTGFMFFSNYGNLMQVSDVDVDQIMISVEQLTLTRQLPKGIKYFDVYCFHADDSDLHSAFQHHWLNVSDIHEFKW
jgi:FkbM family methyltransferase